MTHLRVALGALLLSAAVVEGQVTLQGVGATFPYPMYSKWFDSYHRAHPDIEIDYQSIGSGGGTYQALSIERISDGLMTKGGYRAA